MRLEFNKLVRDRIPEIIRLDDGEPETVILSEDAYEKALFEKVVEEAVELQEAGSREELLKEIGDVLEVLYAIRDQTGFSDEEIEALRLRRRKDRGAFKKRIFLKYVDK